MGGGFVATGEGAVTVVEGDGMEREGGKGGGEGDGGTVGGKPLLGFDDQLVGSEPKEVNKIRWSALPVPRTSENEKLPTNNNNLNKYSDYLRGKGERRKRRREMRGKGEPVGQGAVAR